jgi:hypothetical protein
MPNGYEEERDAVWQRSRFWGFVWQIGDTTYYLGLLGSVIIPLATIGAGIMNSESRRSLLLVLAFATAAFLICFPIGFAVCMVLKALARSRTGLKTWNME